MAGLQPNHDPAVQEALQWLKDNGCDSCASDQPSNPRQTKRFIPAQAVRKHLDYTRLTTIIQALRPTCQLFQCQQVAGRIVREGYHLVFCILLRINKAPHIETFLRHDLSDKILPVDQRPHGFPDSVSFEDFRDKQWPFCAYRLFTGMVKSISSEKIIAIESRTELAKGDGSTIYKIQVHPEYDGLQDDDTSVNSHLSHTYVLKAYDGAEAQKHHDAEVEAYDKIHSGGLPIENLLRYYGTYTYEGKYYVILEYADVGTLEDFLRETPKPTRGEHIIGIWRGAFGLVEAVFRVHMQHGWHQDIDMENILVRSKPGVSPYSWSMKLADYGRSHFKDPDSTSIVMADYDTFGTKTYGAPECYRSDRFSQTTRLQVPQGVDIWSLGCVWSELAVWIVKGYDGLQAYRKRRRAATDELGLQNPGCFHDGKAVLPCIQEVHNGLRWDSMSDEDYVTGKIWQGLIEQMLHSKGNERPHSRELRQETTKRLSEAEARLTPPVRINKAADIPQTTIRSHSRARTVPNISEPDVTAEQRRRNTSAAVVPSVYYDGHSYLMQSPRQSFDRPEGSGDPSSISRNRNSGHTQPLVEEEDDSGVGPSTPQRSATLPRAGYTYPSSLRSSANSATMRSQVSPTGRSQSRESPWQHDSTVPGSSHRDIPERGHRDGLGSQNCEDTPPGNRSCSDTQIPLPTDRAPPHRNEPVLELLSAFYWMSEKRRGIRSARLPYGAELKGLLRGRDHLFIVDDSTSMYSSRAELCALFELLAYIVEEDDPDGVEVLCTNTGVSLKEIDSSKLARHINSIEWDGRTNLENRLVRVLGGYAEQLEARGSRPRDPVTPLTVYVLTDGVWQGGGEPEVPIMKLVYTLAELGLDRRQVGVQFIVFGENAAGWQHLQQVDDMQKAYGLPL
ncbi:hypothetical protein LTR17_023122 [Elasticomyces elasticus]|nr:hypothetical protein LTR17_023122 [Elasticomyces elasticus]